MEIYLTKENKIITFWADSAELNNLKSTMLEKSAYDTLRSILHESLSYNNNIVLNT